MDEMYEASHRLNEESARIYLTLCFRDFQKTGLPNIDGDIVLINRSEIKTAIDFISSKLAGSEELSMFLEFARANGLS